MSVKHINLDVLEAGMDYLMNMNRMNINKKKLEPISNQTCIYYNSVNIFCGRQGSGKTYSGMKEIIKISHISPKTHLLVAITKDESKDDPTITSLLPLLNIPVVYISEDEAEEYVKHLLLCMRMYNMIKQNHSENVPVEEDETQRITQPRGEEQQENNRARRNKDEPTTNSSAHFDGNHPTVHATPMTLSPHAPM